jgi:hypothetical protein|tara:strand:+ start:490 stop:795 length:306 start_codon:yes stop_codon:yes gene_type:complete
MEYIKHTDSGSVTHYSFNEGRSSFGESPGNTDYDRMMQEVADGKSTIVDQDDTHVPTVDELRRAGYGSWREQFDMLYHDQVDGTSKWPDHVAKVKADHPKK